MEPWFYGEALPGCGGIFKNKIPNSLTDVASLFDLSVVNDQSFKMFVGSHMQTPLHWTQSSGCCVFVCLFFCFHFLTSHSSTAFVFSILFVGNVQHDVPKLAPFRDANEVFCA